MHLVYQCWYGYVCAFFPSFSIEYSISMNADFCQTCDRVCTKWDFVANVKSYINVFQT